MRVWVSCLVSLLMFTPSAFADPAHAGSAQAEAAILPFALQGVLKQGGLVRAKIAPGAKVTVDDRALLLDKAGNFYFRL